MSSCSSTSENFKHLFMDSFTDLLGLFFFFSFFFPTFVFVCHFFTVMLSQMCSTDIFPSLCLMKQKWMFYLSSASFVCIIAKTLWWHIIPGCLFFLVTLYPDCTVFDSTCIQIIYYTCKGIQLYFETILMYSGCIDVSRAPPLSDSK